MKINKKIKNEQTKDELSTVQQTLAKLTPKQLKKFNKEMQYFAIEEMLLSIMQQDV